MQEVKTLGETGTLITTDSKYKELIERVGTVENNINQSEAAEYIKHSSVSKKDIKETFKDTKRLNEKAGKFAKIFLNYVQNFEEKAKEKGIGIIMSGNPGTGKTYFANCIWNALKEKHKVYKTSFGKYVREIQDKFEEDRFLDRVKNADLIILDDLGNEYFKEDKNGSWKKEVLFNLFNTIYENEICLIITTNLNEQQLKEFFEIKKSYKVYDRILERCAGFEFDWESRRPDLYKKELTELFRLPGVVTDEKVRKGIETRV